VPRLLFGLLVLVLAIATEGSNGQLRRAPNYTLIEPGLYLGGWVEKPPEGVTAVLNVSERKDIYRTERHLWKPIDDSKQGATLDFLQEAVAFIDAQRKARRATFVHCNEGVSRAPTVMAAYLLYSKKWSRRQALDFLSEQRPVIRPNPAFMDLLFFWEQRLMKEAHGLSKKLGSPAEPASKASKNGISWWGSEIAKKPAFHRLAVVIKSHPNK
jgi:hypothetical protein